MSTQNPKFKTIDPHDAPLPEIHKLLLGGVTPRPIALVSTVSADGIPNLAPFSYYNAFGANPPYIAFSPANSGRDGSIKDTLNNLRAVPECVVHAVSHAMVQQVSLASATFPPEVNEFEKAGFTAIPADRVKPQRVQESPFHMECEVDQIVELGGSKGSGNLVICRVVTFHVNETVIHEGVIDPQAIDLVGRNSANFYTRASGDAIFTLKKPVGVGVGIDALPEHIKTSTLLTANHLAQLGGLEALPTQSAIGAFVASHGKAEVDDPGYRGLFSQGLQLLGSEGERGRTLIESAATLALDAGDVDFAICALMSL
ncbi:MAG: flavin reductase family protein [Candidatus Marinimicrobia bacterium]|nr:flavin reductase family protein [Candidatus Neomarinimicrobiota bacterium]MCF7904180.1 flavin reductase family protein [Candidatus Neomarinimicrobiota bacterium]